jgi:nitrous-oxide reductase
MVSKNLKFLWVMVFLLSASLIFLPACKKEGRKGRSEIEEAALKQYVPPGEWDEFYLFMSGGHSGQVYVYGVPSMRHIRTIPVFAPYPATGYGFDAETKKMLGEYTWGDVHHPALSQTNAEYDGRWLFVNDNANGRIARIDLRTFKTVEIYGPIPNIAGNHGSAYITPNTEYSLFATRFSIPIPKGTYAPVEEYATKYKGIVGAVKIDPQTGHMSEGWQVLLPPFNYDLGYGGRKVSYGWAFWTCYNSERATGKLEVTASQKEKDYIVAVNWKEVEKVIEQGKYEMIGGAKVVDASKVPGIAYFIPCGKSPHGVDVDPSGEYIVGSGKLSPTVSVFSFSKFMKAIENKDFEGEEDGIPVVKFESVRVAEVPVGLGPLHTQFDDKGFAYTSLFVESAIAKWRVGPPWDVVDKIPVAYNVGHLTVAGGDTGKPYGKWLVACNKLSKGRHLPVGPSQPESAQLIDISGEKMRIIAEAYPEPEPHYAVMVPRDLLKPIEVYVRNVDNKDPNAIWSEAEARQERKGNVVEVWAMAVRSYIAPYKIECEQGDKVIIHLTNIEEMRDEIHGFAICFYNINVVPDPGETVHIEFIADKPGVFPYYCTNFCSALHQEMQGYLVVKPKRIARLEKGLLASLKP